MKRELIFATLVVLFHSLALAQDYGGKARIAGEVTDTEGKPLEGVKVKLFFLKTETGFETFTDAEGKWKASWIKSGTWYIDFEKIGYEPKKISYEVSETLKNPPLAVKIKKTEGLFISDELKAELIKGNGLFDEKKYEDALTVFKTIIEKFPDAYIINLSICNCYFQMEDYGRAEEFYLKVLEKDAKNSSAQIGIGNSHSNRGDHALAAEWYQKVDLEKIDDPIVLYNLGSYFYNNAKYEEALKYFRRAVDIQENFLDGLYQLGLTYLARGQNKEALEEFENYLKTDSDSERAAQVKSFVEFLKKKTGP